MAEQTDTPCSSDEPLPPIMALRTRLGLTQEEFGARIGLQTKGSVSLAERGLKPISPDVALAIEELSGGTVNASAMNAIVARARGQEGLFDHGATNSANLAAVSPGKSADCFPGNTDELPGRALSHPDARGGEGLAPEGTSGGSAGFVGYPANASQSVQAPAAAGPYAGSSGASFEVEAAE